MSGWRYIINSLRQYRRVHLAVAAGVAVATAVITGALLVGDSVRCSLRGLALAGLGRIDSVLMAEHPFRESLANEWLADSAVKSHFTDAVPLLLTQGAISFSPSGEVRRTSGLQVIGTPLEFWRLGRNPVDPSIELSEGVALTESIAAELGVKVGDTILLRLPLTSSIPADSTLGEKEETSASRRLKVAMILADADLSRTDLGGAFPARFSLRPSQQAPRNVFVPLKTLQELLELDGKANAIALAVDDARADQPVAVDALNEVEAALRPELSDFGLQVDRKLVGDDPAQAYSRIAADRLVLAPHVVAVAERLFGKDGLQPVVTYLANAIVAGERRVPYSTVVGVDSTEALGPVVDADGKPILLEENEIALNDWAARDLGVEVGGAVRLLWYEPETTHGRLREHEPLELNVRAILPLARPDGTPTAAADPNFAPELPGVTDQASIDDWQLPFDLVETIRDEDEKYWDDYRTTPKAFVSHALAARLWHTRWGAESILKAPIEGGGRPVEAASEELRAALEPSELGMVLLAAKRQALAAASGTTPFDGLFLGFSFFLMASAVLLVALLFRLGVEQRAREIGLLMAVGVTPARLRRLLSIEATIVAAIGAILGAAGGVGYARLMIHGLNTWWVDATAAPFLQLHITPRSILIGIAAGLGVAIATIALSLWRYARLPARQLLAGDAQPPLSTGGAGRWSRRWIPVLCIGLAGGLCAMAMMLEGEAQAGAFFVSGALTLAGALLVIRGKLRTVVVRPPISLNLVGLAARNARRNPSRAMLSLALASLASFLIVALSSFRLAPTDSGTGGYQLLASADLPIQFDLGMLDGRRDLGFVDDDSQKLESSTFMSFRVHDGEDASCLNLYQPIQPRVLGAPKSLAENDRFAWAGAAKTPSGSNAGPWTQLDSDLGNDQSGRAIIPIVLDRNTAYYSLKLDGVGARFLIRDAFDRPATLQVVGLLANSVLQGDVIMSDSHFVRLFPDEAGRRFFLIRCDAKSPPVEDVAAMLETQLEDFGFDVVNARVRLAQLLAVQNTYLSTFQSLGALGLLLGVVGLAVVQLRSVIERRGELALMQAAGFPRRRLAGMVLAENLVLLIGGLGLGCVAALVAVLPHAVTQQAGVPWVTLALLLSIVAVAGVAAAWLASRSVLRAPLIPALRGD